MRIAAQQPARRGIAWRRIAVPYLYILPFLLLFMAFRVYPLIYGLYISFTNTTLGENTSHFVGLSNYTHLNKDPRFVHSFRADHGRAVIGAIPLLVVFLVANRQIIEGVQFSGLKM